MFKILAAFWVVVAMSLSSSFVRADGPTPANRPEGSAAESEFRSLHDAYVAKFKPLFLRSAKAWWVANTTGSDAAYAEKKQAEAALVDLHSDKTTYAKLKALRDGGQVADPVLKRELEVMYHTFLGGQGDPALHKKIVDIENEVEQTFNTHRSKVGGKEMTENDVRQIPLRHEGLSEGQGGMEGYMAVGRRSRASSRRSFGCEMSWPGNWASRIST
jgi:hypothetical protein